MLLFTFSIQPVEARLYKEDNHADLILNSWKPGKYPEDSYHNINNLLVRSIRSKRKAPKRIFLKVIISNPDESLTRKQRLVKKQIFEFPLTSNNQTEVYDSMNDLLQLKQLKQRKKKRKKRQKCRTTRTHTMK